MVRAPIGRSLAVGLVAVAGGLCLAMPFWADQALFTVYARQITHGAILYRDLFDVKQPGIFVFYALGGLLFGSTEVGIHLFELAYWLAFSVFAVVALRPYCTTRWGASLVPIFTVLVYYLHSEPVDLTQIEMLVAFPVLLAWWLMDQAEPGTRRGLERFAAAGLASAAVVLFKYVYLLTILAFLVYGIVRARRRGVPTAVVVRSVGAFAIALLVPLAAVAIYFAAHGQLGRIWWAYVDVAPAAQLLGDKSLFHLKLGARRFMIGHAPILILALIGFAHGRGQRTGRRLDLIAGMALWVASSAVAFLLQNWALYKWLLFTVPLGILAVAGLEVVAATAATTGATGGALVLTAGTALAVLSFTLSASNPEVQTWLLSSVGVGIAAAASAAFYPRRCLSHGMLHAVAAALAVSVGLSAIGPARKLRGLTEHGFALTGDARDAFQRSSYDSYRAADADLAVLMMGDGSPGPLYVFGDPVLLLRAHRPQPIPFAGWVPEYLDRTAWEEMARDLGSALPAYIVIDAATESTIRTRNPAILELVASKYRVSFVGASGVWYVLR